MKMFNKNLRRMLHEQGLKQKDLAKMLNVSTATVSDWCKGKKMPRMNMLNAICDALQCPLSELTEPERPNVEQTILNVLKPMSDKQKHMVLAYAKFIAKEGDVR